MIKRTGFTCILFAATVFGVNVAKADAQQSSDRSVSAITKSLQKIFPGRTPESIEPLKASRFYEVVVGTEVYYMSEDGRYLIQGDLFDVARRENITELKRAVGRKELIAGVDESTMIVYEPERPRYTVTVFTDIDCPYCRKMHQQMAEYNRLGIRIRYLAFPRAGLGSKSYRKAVAVWCANDPQTAMTKAKAGKDPVYKTCKDNPVKDHLALVQQLGLTGTPNLILEDGTLIPGYVPPARLLEILESEQ